jgi:hypothetical protein
MLLISFLDVEYLVKTEPVEITVSSGDLWWPNGFGEQKLFDVYIQLNRDDIHLDEVDKTSLDLVLSFFFKFYY